MVGNAYIALRNGRISRRGLKKRSKICDSFVLLFVINFILLLFVYKLAVLLIYKLNMTNIYTPQLLCINFSQSFMMQAFLK